MATQATVEGKGLTTTAWVRRDLQSWLAVPRVQVVLPVCIHSNPATARAAPDAAQQPERHHPQEAWGLGLDHSTSCHTDMAAASSALPKHPEDPQVLGARSRCCLQGAPLLASGTHPVLTFHALGQEEHLGLCFITIPNFQPGRHSAMVAPLFSLQLGPLTG